MEKQLRQDYKTFINNPTAETSCELDAVLLKLVSGVLLDAVERPLLELRQVRDATADAGQPLKDDLHRPDVNRVSDHSVRYVVAVLIIVPPLHALTLTHSEMRGTGAGLL